MIGLTLVRRTTENVTEDRFNEAEGAAGEPLDFQRPRRLELGFRVAF